METESAWVVQLPELITGPELSSADYAAKEDALIAAIRASDDGILQILHPLGHYLVTENDTPRAKASNLLAKIVKDIPECVRTLGDVHHLADFFTARLRDWPAIRGALLGCLALLERSRPLTELSTGSAVTMLEAFVKGVYVRSLSAFDRATALAALRIAVQRHGQAALDANVDILDFCIASVDGEKDPRCLIHGFQAVRAVLRLYIAQEDISMAAGRLEESTEELFDVLSCYFPVSFTPPPNDPHGITRDQIANELERTLTTYDAFAPHVVRLAAEKLSSTLVTAKMDSLSLLRAAAQSYGPRTLLDQVSSIWTALKVEIMAPAQDGLVEPELVKVEEVAKAAADCLRACVVAFASQGDHYLVNLVLNDVAVEDMLSCLKTPGVDKASRKRSVARVKATCGALGALGAAGGESSHRMMAKMLPAVLDVVKASSQPETLDLAWAALVALLRSTAGENGEKKSQESEDKVWGQSEQQLLLQELLHVCLDLDFASLETQGTITEEESEDVGSGLWQRDLQNLSPGRLVWLKLLALQAIFGCASLAAAVPSSNTEKILKILAGVITNSEVEDRKVAHAASAALCAIAQSSHSRLGATTAVPLLLEAGTQVSASRKAALGALKALCFANTAVILEQTMIGFDSSVQLTLPRAVLQSSKEDAEALADVLSTCSDIILELSTEVAATNEAAKAQQAAHFGRFAQHLLDAVLLLQGEHQESPSSAETAALLGDPIANTMFLGTREAPVELQQEISKVAVATVRAPPMETDSTFLLPLSASCAALVALKQSVAQDVVAMEQNSELLSALARYAVENNAFLTAEALQRCASAAFASFLNKLEPKKLEESFKVAELLDQWVEKVTSSGSVRAEEDALVTSVLAEATRALALRGSPCADRVIRQMVSKLAATPSESLQNASQFFSLVLKAPKAASAVPALSPASHAVIRPLWQQRTYSIAMSALNTVSDKFSPPIVLAMGNLLGAAAPAVLKANPSQTIALLTLSLAELQSFPELATNKSLLQSLISNTRDFLATANGRKEAEASLPRLIPALLGLVQYQPSMAVREASLECLTLLMLLPYASLHPYKKDVLKAASDGCDDMKRKVRHAAACCAEAWRGGQTSA